MYVKIGVDPVGPRRTRGGMAHTPPGRIPRRCPARAGSDRSPGSSPPVPSLPAGRGHGLPVDLLQPVSHGGHGVRVPRRPPGAACAAGRRPRRLPTPRDGPGAGLGRQKTAPGAPCRRLPTRPCSTKSRTGGRSGPTTGQPHARASAAGGAEPLPPRKGQDGHRRRLVQRRQLVGRRRTPARSPVTATSEALRGAPSVPWKAREGDGHTVEIGGKAARSDRSSARYERRPSPRYT